jgi:hypothetical protein
MATNGNVETTDSALEECAANRFGDVSLLPTNGVEPIAFGTLQLVEIMRFELTTSAVRLQRSPN